MTATSMTEAELEALWTDIVHIYRELPATEDRRDHRAQTRRRLLMQCLSAKFAAVEQLVSTQTLDYEEVRTA